MPAKGLKMAKILIVDDKPLNRSVLTTLLGYQGHDLAEASSGAEALEKVQLEEPELVITDILMPAMDGYEFVTRLRALPQIPQPKVIFHSATYLESEARALARACGVSSVMCKPTEPAEVLRIVDETLATRAGRGGAVQEGARAAEEAVKVLSNKLYDKIQETEELNATLERRVAERTAELDRLNRALQMQIAERQKAEEEVLRSREEQLRTKSEFLSHVSHELRSPLAVVHQFTTILLDGIAGPLPADQREYLEISLRNIDQLKTMIDDLLEASRADLGKLTVNRSSISIATVIGEVMKSQSAAAAAKNIQLKQDIAPDLPPIHADAKRIFQVLTNLVDNAVKFSPVGAVISLRAQMLEHDPHFVRVSVADCGCGIKPEDATRIFDRLFQAQRDNHLSRQGLGLGLYICRELVERHGGVIWVEAGCHEGSTFHFTLPVFSLNSLIAPLLVHEGRISPRIVFLTVKVFSSAGWTHERDRQRAVFRVQRVLERCSLPDLDILLPAQHWDNLVLFGIAARADARGAAVMVSRIREQLSRCDDLASAGVLCAVDSQVIDLVQLTQGLTFDGCAACVAGYLQDQFKRLRTKEECNEQQESAPR
ncbi:MAG TPA: ATP-binding protein [Candidatus Sulfotelmatobacter sp.]|nr:ATP-binding protein [Candidatus Sulfotelmatobacter sp.]